MAKQYTDGSMVQISNLTKDYGSIRALDSVSFEIRSGEVLGLLGPNGAGKTTLMRVITGYLRPTRGTVTVGGNDVREDPDLTRERIGYLPEFSPLYHDMMTYDYLKFVAGIRGVPRRKREERIRELSKLCGLDGVMHQMFRELSHGFKQRVGLAHAMIGDPDVLILDEPTSGLDPNQIVKIRSIIKDVGRTKTVVLSTHLLNEAETTCGRIVIINEGKLVADGTPQELRSSISGAQVVKLSLRNARFSDVKALLSGIGGVREVLDLSPDRAMAAGAPPGAVLELSVTCDSDISDAIYRAVKAQDWMISGFASERSSLENVFRGLTDSVTEETERTE